MIIACPACATRYVVPDSAIGLEGRTVRCAKCKHSWFQDGPQLAEPITAAYAAPPPVDAEPTNPARVPGPETSPEPRVAPTRRAVEHEERSQAVEVQPDAPSTAHEPDETAFDDEAEPDRRLVVAEVPGLEDRARVEWGDGDSGSAVAEHDVSQFEHSPPFRPRRNWLRWMSWGAGTFAVVALAAVAAMSAFGVPSWLPIEKPLFGADPGLKVEFPASEQERRTLPNGAEFFGARVIVKNDARETRAVPPLLIVLRDERERVVYSWELVPPQRSLAPGEAMTINEAMTDVPKSAVYADIGWAPR